jgi:dihydrofolate synthase/folylpolyglutamate synthase
MLRDPSDEPFFREWKHRKPNEQRSLIRARRLANLLNLENVSCPILTIVGSKGKATATTYCSVTLTASGQKVGTISSPPIITNRERIRVNGRAISSRAYKDLSRNLNAILKDFARDGSEDGYLSPSGLFIIMGLHYLLDEGCDVAVLEAGMGGRSDEVSLFPPSVVAITTIFGEHLGVIGNSVSEIAHDKVGVASSSTKIVLTVPQSVEVMQVLSIEVERKGCKLVIIEPSNLENNYKKLKLPPGLSAMNAVLGLQAGYHLLDLQGVPLPSPVNLENLVSTVEMPGRLSLHSDQQGRTWVVDAAINGQGVTIALNWAVAKLGEVDTIIVSVPLGKDVKGVRDALKLRHFIPVSLDTEHLKFDDDWGTRLIPIDSIDKHIKGSRILAVGTWSFISSILKRFGVSYERSYYSAR